MNKSIWLQLWIFVSLEIFICGFVTRRNNLIIQDVANKRIDATSFYRNPPCSNRRIVNVDLGFLSRLQAGARVACSRRSYRFLNGPDSPGKRVDEKTETGEKTGVTPDSTFKMHVHTWNARNFIFICTLGIVVGFIIQPQYEIIPESFQKRSGEQRLQNIIQALLRNQGLDRNRRGPLWGDFGVGSRWSAGSNAANMLKTYEDLNGPNSPGKRK